MDENLYFVIVVASGIENESRRKAIRNSWKLYLSSTESSLKEGLRKRISFQFVVGKDERGFPASLLEENKNHQDMLLVDVLDSYDNLILKILHAMKWAMDSTHFTYFLYVDDDSFVRLDLLTELFRNKPKQRFYWGYMWNLGDRFTKPIRDPTAKSYMPHDQYPDEDYPPFASGSGYVLTSDIVSYLVQNMNTLPFFRLADVAIGMYLKPISLEIKYENEEKVRAYRPIPLFRFDTIIQHYMRPEEFRTFYKKSIGMEPHEESHNALEFYKLMTSMNLIKH